jgi:hypothetical protein
MNNCIVCHRPVPDNCYVVLKGNFNNKRKEFVLERDEIEFLCLSCIDIIIDDGLCIDGIKIK